MAIITISRSFCSKGRVVAEQVANELGHACISREILLKASKHFNIPEIQLAKAIHDGPTVFERFTHEKEKYISYIRSALLNQLKSGNIVYHGLAGHFFIQNIHQILKIRTLSNFEDRIKEEVLREGVSEIVARKQLLEDDKQRRQWSTYMYKMDTSDPELYDMTINLNQMSIDDCVQIICSTASLESFKITDETQRILEDEALAATVKAALVNKFFNTVVNANNNKVVVSIVDPATDPDKIKSEVGSLLKKLDTITQLSINVKSNNIGRTTMHKP